MKARKTVYILVAALLSALPLAAQKDKAQVVESVWTPTPLQIDGQAADWTPESLALWKEFNINYGFKNDANFLYLIAVFNDPKFLSSLDQTGMFFWINAEGKDKKTHGFHLYQKVVTADQLIAQMEQSGQTLPEEKKKELKARPQYKMFACDVVNKKGEAIPHPGTGTGTYRYTRGKTNAVFEAVVPLPLLSDPAAKTKLDPYNPFKFGIEWGGMTEEMKKQRAAQIGDQGARASAGESDLESQLGGGEGADFRAPSASLAGMRRGPKQYSFWLNLKIADKK